MRIIILSYKPGKKMKKRWAHHRQRRDGQ